MQQRISRKKAQNKYKLIVLLNDKNNRLTLIGWAALLFREGGEWREDEQTSIIHRISI